MNTDDSLTVAAKRLDLLSICKTLFIIGLILIYFLFIVFFFTFLNAFLVVLSSERDFADRKLKLTHCPDTENHDNP